MSPSSRQIPRADGRVMGISARWQRPLSIGNAKSRLTRLIFVAGIGTGVLAVLVIGIVCSVEDPLRLSRTCGGNNEETQPKLHGLAALIEGEEDQASKGSGEVETSQGMKYVQVDSGEDGVSRYAAVTDEGERPVSIKTWLDLVGGDTADGERASSGLSDVLSSCPYGSLFLETPGTTLGASSTAPFEFVLVDAPGLMYAERDPDEGSFAGHFAACLRESGGGAPPTVCHFANLGGDAGLVAPLPQEGVEPRTYSHLAAFVRDGPRRQVLEFWRVGAQRYASTLRDRDSRWGPSSRSWMSTNGMGVSWLHLRLDSVPKYYTYRAFASGS